MTSRKLGYLPYYVILRSADGSLADSPSPIGLKRYQLRRSEISLAGFWRPWDRVVVKEVCFLVAAVAAAAIAPLAARGTSLSITLTGKPEYFHRQHVEIDGATEAEQAIYQSSWAGEMGFRIAGLKAEPYRVHLGYAEVDTTSPDARYFDILLNGKVVKKEVCIFAAVGNRRVLGYDFTVTPQGGVITYFERRSVPTADPPSFTLIRLYDAVGNLVMERSAYATRPPDWERRDYLDETNGIPAPNDHRAPPWPGSYKIHADQVSRMTAADVLGPDGIVYPNWTHVGIPGGIPALANTLSAADFGVVPDGENDSSAAFQKAIDALEASGGGVLFIPAGRYFLDRPVFVTGDHCVLRGAGAKKTRFISRFSMRGLPPEFHAVQPGGKIGPSTSVDVWVDPQGMTDLTLSAGGKVIQSVKKSGLWETQVQYGYLGSLILAAIGPGPAELRATATYRDGTVRSAMLSGELTASEVVQERPVEPLGIINFFGYGHAGAPMLALAAGAKRGALSLDLAPGHGLAAGDRIQVVAPDTPRWSALLRTKIQDAFQRANQYQIAAVHGDRLILPEALRVEYPMIDGPYVQKIRPILRCGIEDLGFEQITPTRVHAIVFVNDWECWARGLEIVHCGDKALYMPSSKRGEARDCVLDRSWCNNGGSAYVGWESSFDCLMENVTTYDMRHAPMVQWASSGNVIRSSVFHGSDAQWHAGWTNENLYEEDTVESEQLAGSYGAGGWAAGPDSRGHGPVGPRNVVYNCDITSPRDGLWMGGMNENWLILYNRFVVGRGPAIFAKDASFDHIIRGNVFVMLEPRPAAIYLGSPDCTGIEVIGNRFYGPVGALFGGFVAPAVDRDNRVRASGGIARPRPAVRSIYEWEQEHRAEIEADAAGRAQG